MSVLSEIVRQSQRAMSQHSGSPNYSLIPNPLNYTTLDMESSLISKWKSWKAWFPGFLPSSDIQWHKLSRSNLLFRTDGRPASVPSARLPSGRMKNPWSVSNGPSYQTSAPCPLFLNMQPLRSNFFKTKLLLLIFIFFWLQGEWLMPKATIWNPHLPKGEVQIPKALGDSDNFFFFNRFYLFLFPRRYQADRSGR